MDGEDIENKASISPSNTAAKLLSDSYAPTMSYSFLHLSPALAAAQDWVILLHVPAA